MPKTSSSVFVTNSKRRRSSFSPSLIVASVKVSSMDFPPSKPTFFASSTDAGLLVIIAEVQYLTKSANGSELATKSVSELISRTIASFPEAKTFVLPSAAMRELFLQL